MAGRCKICFHPERLEIERQILQGALECDRTFSYRKIALCFGVSKSAIRNHFWEHMIMPQAKEWKEFLGLGRLGRRNGG